MGILGKACNSIRVIFHSLYLFPFASKQRGGPGIRTKHVNHQSNTYADSGDLGLHCTKTPRDLTLPSLVLTSRGITSSRLSTCTKIVKLSCPCTPPNQLPWKVSDIHRRMAEYLASDFAEILYPVLDCSFRTSRVMIHFTHFLVLFPIFLLCWLFSPFNVDCRKSIVLIYLRGRGISFT